MFHDITVLIVASGWQEAEAIDTALSPHRFNVLRSTSFLSAMRAIPQSDTLILDWALENGQAETILSSWLRQSTEGPICVLEDRMNAKQRNELTRRVNSILTKPIDSDDIVAVLQRFASWVRGQRAMKEVRVMRKWLVALTIAVAALGGTEIVLPLVKMLLGS